MLLKLTSASLLWFNSNLKAVLLRILGNSGCHLESSTVGSISLCQLTLYYFTWHVFVYEY